MPSNGLASQLRFSRYAERGRLTVSQRKINTMKQDKFKILMRAVFRIERRLDNIEANSRLSASTVQPLVGPPGNVEGEPAALARPVSLAEVETLLKDIFRKWKIACEYHDSRVTLECIEKEIIQRMQELDQGPIAKRVTKKSGQGITNHPPGRIRQ